MAPGRRPAGRVSAVCVGCARGPRRRCAASAPCWQRAGCMSAVRESCEGRPRRCGAALAASRKRICHVQVLCATRSRRPGAASASRWRRGSRMFAVREGFARGVSARTAQMRLFRHRWSCHACTTQFASAVRKKCLAFCAVLVPPPDVIILARGGGSVEDLSAFDSRLVAMAAVEAVACVVSAIGHETDHPILDLCSDVRAKTPTAAMQMTLPNRTQLVEELSQKHDDLMRMVAARIDAQRTRIDWLRQSIMCVHAMACKEMKARVTLGTTRIVGTTTSLVMKKRQHADQLHRAVFRATERRIREMSEGLAKVYSLMPHTSLKRGLCLALDGDGKRICRSGDAVCADSFTLLFEDGSVRVRISE